MNRIDRQKLSRATHESLQQLAKFIGIDSPRLVETCPGCRVCLIELVVRRLDAIDLEVAKVTGVSKKGPRR